MKRMTVYWLANCVSCTVLLVSYCEKWIIMWVISLCVTAWLSALLITND